MNGGARNVIAGEYAAEALAEARMAVVHRQNSKLNELRSLTMNDQAFAAWQKANLTGDARTNMQRIQAEIDRLSVPADCTCPACTAADLLAD